MGSARCGVGRRTRWCCAEGSPASSIHRDGLATELGPAKVEEKYGEEDKTRVISRTFDQYRRDVGDRVRDGRRGRPVPCRTRPSTGRNSSRRDSGRSTSTWTDPIPPVRTGKRFRRCAGNSRPRGAASRSRNPRRNGEVNVQRCGYRNRLFHAGQLERLRAPIAPNAVVGITGTPGTGTGGAGSHP